MRNEAPKFEKTAAEVTASVAAAKRAAEEKLAELVAEDPAEATFESTFVAFDAILGTLHTIGERLSVIRGLAHPQGDFAAALTEGSQAIEGLTAEFCRNEAVYNLLVSTEKKLHRNWMSAEDNQLITLLLDRFFESGVALSGQQRDEIAGIRSRLNEATMRFGETFDRADATTLTLTEDEVQGLPQDLREALTVDGGQYTAGDLDTIWRISTASPREDVRKKAFDTASQRPADAVDALREIFELRMRLAKVYGKDSWIDYRASKAMAGSADEVRRFLDSATNGVAQKFAEEKSLLEGLKLADTGSTDVQQWDAQYYADKFVAENLPPDAGSINEFFEFQHTVEKTLEFFSQMLSLKLEEIPRIDLPGGEGSAYYVTDKVTGEPFGTLVLDLLAREGKDWGFADNLKMRQMERGHLKGKALALVSLAFNRPTASMPGLMSPMEISMLFHELGHAFHMLAHTSKYASIFDSWGADGVEVASMLMENVAKSPEVLSRLARHYADPSKQLPLETLRKIQEASKAVMTITDTGWFVAKANEDLMVASFSSED